MLTIALIRKCYDRQDTTKKISDLTKKREQSGNVSNDLREHQREASEKVQGISKEIRELKSRLQVFPSSPSPV